jgi:hypothetical protein
VEKCSSAMSNTFEIGRWYLKRGTIGDVYAFVVDLESRGAWSVVVQTRDDYRTEHSRFGSGYEGKPHHLWRVTETRQSCLSPSIQRLSTWRELPRGLSAKLAHVALAVETFMGTCLRHQDCLDHSELARSCFRARRDRIRNRKR